MKIKVNFGIVRIAVVRSIFLFSLGTFSMVLIDFVRKYGWHWWYLLMPAVLVAWWWFDMVVIWKQEVNASLQYSEEFQELKRMVSELKQ